jgi:hypothetical protein
MNSQRNIVSSISWTILATTIPVSVRPPIPVIWGDTPPFVESAFRTIEAQRPQCSADAIRAIRLFWQGHYVGKLIKARLRGAAEIGPFRYRDYGNLATIGRKAAIIDFGWIRLRGLFACLIWTVAHIYFLIGFRNRMIVALNWLWAYFTFQRAARLITGPIR